MDWPEVYERLGVERSDRLVRSVSIGALKTFKVYKALKIRSQLHTLNRQKLRAASGNLWHRIVRGDADLAHELTQAVLVSNIDFVVEVLDHLGIEHGGNGFLAKEGDYAEQLGAGWERTVFDTFRNRYPEELVLLYINHLGWETATLERPFLGDGPDGSESATS